MTVLVRHGRRLSSPVNAGVALFFQGTGARCSVHQARCPLIERLEYVNVRKYASE